ncbi:Predicted arabinose efflux permease, MFS family [Marinactinospora thermotolerans DSM 45154]|uniref:Predicted arabinose efflux permease, MFS family n=1 Tax=Marinactinospora thermotolerans DSM 45154 TaxID=1122192 RepID=A0A1T4TE34_9ACTN|nr:MFS transporter [Marinactinospora thermotolerans]SKA38449.1 Predicted arabinose efflux permease, MFS family [Marinactinospora thermotolerans DSM 45154]
MPAWLVALATGALVFYTDDYVIAGVIPEIAADLGVSTALAGQLVTVFSLTVAVAAPVAAVLTARLRRRTVLTAAAAVFTAANALAALAPGYEVLLGLRVVAALAAAAATPSLFSAAAQLAPPDRIGRHVAVVSFGVTGAIALGVPVGTWVGGAWGWRATFALMAVAGAGVTVAFAALVPRRAGAREALPVRAQLGVLARPAISVGLVANLVLMLGSMMLLTYLAPFAAGITGTGTTGRGVLFALSGIAGMAGIWAGGRATDRWGPDRTLLLGVAVFVVTMAALAVLWPLRPIPMAVLVPLAVVWGGAAFWNSPAVQARLHLLAGPVSPQALALNTSGTYLGVAAGGAVGGLVIDAAGPGPLPAVSGVCGLVAVALFAFAASRSGSARERSITP